MLLRGGQLRLACLAGLHNYCLPASPLQIVPLENIRGRAKVEAGQLCLRKNGRGVDPNRNWDYHWGEKEKGEHVLGAGCLQGVCRQLLRLGSGSTAARVLALGQEVGGWVVLLGSPACMEQGAEREVDGWTGGCRLPMPRVHSSAPARLRLCSHGWAPLFIGQPDCPRLPLTADYDPNEEYPGTAPFSEPEAALLLRLAQVRAQWPMKRPAAHWGLSASLHGSSTGSSVGLSRDTSCTSLCSSVRMQHCRPPAGLQAACVDQRAQRHGGALHAI